MAQATDNKDLSQAPNAGNPQADMLHAVQQNTATGIIQKMPHSSMAITGEITGQGFLEENKFVTPAAFQATNAKESSYGTVKIADDTAIESKSGDDTLTAGRMDKIFQVGIQETGTIRQLDIDAGASDGTVTIIDFRTSTFGQLGLWNGRFTYVPDSDARVKSIFIDNMRVPVDEQSLSGNYTVNSEDKTPSIGVRLIPISDTDGIGRVRLDIGTTEEGINWDNANTYTVYINGVYFAKIS